MTIFLVLFSIYLLIQVFKTLKKEYLHIPKNKLANNYAVITGCTDGIGKALLYQIANLNYNIIMLSRSVEKMEKEKTCLELSHPHLDIVYQELDFSKISEKSRTELCDLIKYKNISLLVNNVGISYKYPMSFHLLDFDQLKKFLNVNIYSVMFTSHIIINDYLQKKKLYMNMNINDLKIINVGSKLGEINGKFLNIYSCSKLFVYKMSKIMNDEYKYEIKNHINISCINPWLISTKMSKTKYSILSPSPKKYVTSIVTYGFYFPHLFLSLIYYIFVGIPFFSFIIDSIISNKINKIRQYHLRN